MENSAIIKACKLAGGSAKLARRVQVHPTFIYHLRKCLKDVPIKICPKIERESGGEVMRWDLRPNDWWEIWPELIAHPSAPQLPITQSEPA